jgi:hypothetical protein
MQGKSGLRSGVNKLRKGIQSFVGVCVEWGVEGGKCSRMQLCKHCRWNQRLEKRNEKEVLRGTMAHNNVE